MKTEIIINQSDVLKDMIDCIDRDINFFIDCGFGNTKEEIKSDLLKSDVYMDSKAIHASYLMLYNWIQLFEEKATEILDYNTVKYNLNVTYPTDNVIEITDYYKKSYCDLTSNDINTVNQDRMIKKLTKEGYKFDYYKDDEGCQIAVMTSNDDVIEIDQDGNY